MTYTASGLINGDSISGVTLQSDGVPSTAGVAAYSVTASNAQGSGLGNYSITYQPGTLTVDPASLTISATSLHKPYGQTANLTYTASGLINGDSISGVTLQSDGVPSTAGVAAYSVTASNAQGNGLGNYSITYQSGTLTVDPASLIISATSLHKSYGQTANLTYTANGLINGDSISAVALRTAGLPSAAGVGSYTITAADAQGNGLGNYSITYQSGTLTVDPVPLSISADSLHKPYGRTANLTYTANGLINRDSIDTVVLQSPGALPGAHSGKYSISAADAAGNGLGNYSITYLPGVLTVDAAPVTSPALIFPPSVILSAPALPVDGAEHGNLPWLEVVACPGGPPAANIDLRIVMNSGCGGASQQKTGPE